MNPAPKRPTAAIVFVARDERLDRRVVIKLRPPQVTATISAERFKR